MLKNMSAIFAFMIVTFQQQQNVTMIYDYVLQKKIQNGQHKIYGQTWVLKLWLKLDDRTQNLNHTIMTFKNQNQQFIKIYLDSQNFVTLNLDGLVNQQIIEIQSFLIYNDDQFFQEKTDGTNWINFMVVYQNQNVHIFVDTEEQFLNGYDFSEFSQTIIDFAQIEQNCEVTFSNVNIREVDANLTNFTSIYNENKILGFYFFPFISKNRQIVENVYNPEEIPLLVEEFYQLPSNLFIQYNTRNIFQSIKITFPNFWGFYAFYSIKMSMNFSLIGKLILQNTTQAYLNSITLYHRDLKFSVQNMIQNFDIILNLSTDFNQQVTTANGTTTTSNSQILYTNLIYKENGQVVNDQILTDNYTFDLNNKIQNFSYFQHFKSQYTQNYSTNLIYLGINGEIRRLYKQNIRFSKLDQHYCGFSINDVNVNLYYDIMIQEIIFFQEITSNTNSLFMDADQQISLFCNLDNSFPYFQERFLINNNDILTLKNCERLPFFQRCDAFYKCIRCQNNQCKQCADDFYLINGSCLECFYPFMIVDGNCIMPHQTAISVLEPYKDAQINAIIGHIQQKGYQQGFVNILVVNPQNQVYLKSQFLIVSTNGVFGGDQYWNNILLFFSLLIEQQEMQIKASSILTNISPIKTNNLSIFKCFQYFQHINAQFTNCVATCNTDQHLQGQFCTKNYPACATQEKISYNICQQCNSGYQSYYDSNLVLQNCMSQDLSIQTEQKKYLYDHILSLQTFEHSLYTHNQIEYPICNVDQNEYLVNQNCAIKNVQQQNICDVVDQDGNCDIQNHNNMTRGYMLNSDNTLYNYFSDNQEQWIYLTCLRNVDFKASTKGVAKFQELCFWSEHLNQNKSVVFSCMILDPNCQSCDTINNNICTTCITSTFIQFEQHTECGTPLPNCLIHQTYNGQLLCQKCETGYVLVPTDTYIKPIGLCIQQVIPNCQYYYLQDQTLVSCIDSLTCSIGYTETNINELPCIQNQFYLENCSQYLNLQTGQYQCVQCQADYSCIQNDGTIKYDQLATQCKYCILNSNMIEGCYIYDQNYTCKQCYTTHKLNSQNTCESNCIQYGTLDSSQCITCDIGTLPLNNECYLQMNLCYQLYNKGCESCSIGAFLYLDTDLFTKCDMNIQNCSTKSSINPNYCDQCQSGFRRFRTTQDQDICVQEIQNCLNYSKTDKYICDICQDNFRVVTQQNNYELCLEIIQFCIQYNQQNPSLCDQCEQNYQLSQDNFQCDEIIQQQNSISQQPQTQEPQSSETLTKQSKSQQIPCYFQIENCELCSAYDCFKCKENYYLFENTCLQNCLLIDQNCIECQQLSQSQCQVCLEGYYLYDLKCIDPCTVQELSRYCFKYLCIHNNPNCELCDQKDIYKCSQCKTQFTLNTNNICEVETRIVLDPQFTYENCLNYCLICMIEQCQKCMAIYQRTFPECTNFKNSFLIENQQNQYQCPDEVLCFKNSQRINQFCQKCKTLCNIQNNSSLDTFYIHSKDSIQFKNDLKNTQQFEFKFDFNRPNYFEIKILSKKNSVFSFQFKDENLFIQSINCTPQIITQFKISNDIYNFSQLLKNKQKTQNIILGFLFGFTQFFFPGWLVVYFLSSLQKIEILGYISYTNLNAGKVFSFMNSLQETEIQILKFQQSNQNDFQREFELSQYQEFYFNLIDQTTLLTIVSFLATLFIQLSRTIFMNRKKGWREILKISKNQVSIQFSKYCYSIIGVMQIAIIPKVGRYFIIHQNIYTKQQIILYLYDIIVSYYILKKLFKHFNFKKFTEKEDRQHLTIFQQDQQRLENFELIFNYWIALDQSLYLFKGKILYVFQSNPQLAIIFTLAVSILQLGYFLLKFIKFYGYTRIVISNYIISEFLFIVYISIILINSIYQQDQKSETPLNVIYLLLNIFKILENFSAIYTIKKIIQNRLSHYEVKENKIYKVRKTIQDYQDEFKKQSIMSVQSRNQLTVENQVRDHNRNTSISQSSNILTINRQIQFQYVQK